MERIFLGWERPALAAVVDYLWKRYATARRCGPQSCGAGRSRGPCRAEVERSTGGAGPIAAARRCFRQSSPRSVNCPSCSTVAVAPSPRH